MGEVESCLAFDKLISPRSNFQDYDWQDFVEYTTLIGMCHKLEGDYKEALNELKEALAFAKI